MVEAAGVELDRHSKYGLILKTASKSETLETVESLKILLRPPNCPQHNRSLAGRARLAEARKFRVFSVDDHPLVREGIAAVINS